MSAEKSAEPAREADLVRVEDEVLMMLVFLGEMLIESLSLPVGEGEDSSPAQGPSGYAEAEEPATAGPAPRPAIEPPERRPPDSRTVDVVEDGDGDDDLLVDAKGETKVMPLEAE